MAEDGTVLIHDSCKGFCSDCGRVHSLGEGDARFHGKGVIDEFRRIRRLDYQVPDLEADPRLSFDRLFPGDKGHMFGVMECRDQNGETVVLRAFSSLRGGLRHVKGWVPPIHSDEVWEQVVLPTQGKIKALTEEMGREESGSPAFLKISGERKEISRKLVEMVQEALVFTNFRGERRSLRSVFDRPQEIPGGVGDCCGPKLLNHAALHGLKPIGMSEFYWGKQTPSGSRVEGHFYPCCVGKCQPILGFLLCGIDELS